MKLPILISLLTTSFLSAVEKPNVLIIYTDDLGYNDVSCYGNKVLATPNIDRIATEGLKFTQGYATASTCTPSRYSLLTGEYPFRKSARILAGDAKMLIDHKRQNLPDVFKSAGYKTGVIGKWHLGLGEGKEKLNWNKHISPGTSELGFDYSFLIPATNDRVPCVYLRNGNVVNLDPADPIQVSYGKEKIGTDPTGHENPELVTMKSKGEGHNKTIVNGVPRIGYMSGGKSAYWNDENMADDLTDEAIKFMGNSASAGQPFFLYLSTADIHAPRIAHPRFQGKSKLGARGDMTLQLDACVGRLLDFLKEKGLDEKTIVIFSSDNGPVIEDGYQDSSLANATEQNFNPAGILKGGKYKAYEGGTRVPFLIRWTGKIKPGTTSDTLVSQLDLFASFAAMLGQKITPGSAPDSKDTLDAFLGKSDKGRLIHVTQAYRDGLQIREGDWRLLQLRKKVELYNITEDPSEKNNLAKKHPERVKELTKKLEAIKAKP